MLTYPEIDPVAIALGPIKIHWYGLTYLAGLTFAWWLGRRYTRRPWSPLKREHIDDLIFFSALGVVLGGRIGYILFYGMDRLLTDPAWALQIQKGGMSFHGGFIGVILAIWWLGRRRGIAFGDIADFVAPLAPMGLALGRLGNFIGQELWGRAAEVPWAMVFPRDPLQLPRHPSQLYQFALEGLLLFAIVNFYARKPRPRWALAGLFTLGYGCLRFFAEFFREPDAHLGFQALGWVTRGQILCVPMVLIGGALLILAYRSKTVNNGNNKSDNRGELNA